MNSEIMLQQTRVETVIPYWIKWMTTFPTVFDLARASPDDVNKIWAGLGYYRRAQMLLEGAKKVVDVYNGVIPSTVDELLKIPGIGPYTAGAIASIAHGVSTPLVDGNVIRVFSRLVGSRYSIPSSDMDKLCWSIGRKLVDPVDPGSFNQALMELGATVCKPTSARCDECPVKAYCTAYRIVKYNQMKTGSSAVALSQPSSESSKRKAGAVSDDMDVEVNGLPISVSFFPRKSAKKKAAELTYRVKVFSRKDADGRVKYLLVRREKKGLLANQWEFPALCIDDIVGESTSNENEDSAIPYDAESLLSSFKRHLLTNFGVLWKSSELDSADETSVIRYTIIDAPSSQIRSIKDPIVHVFSHQRHTMYLDIHEVLSTDSTTDSSDGKTNTLETTLRESRWMTSSEIIEAGATTGCKKVLTAIEKRDPKPKKSSSSKNSSSSTSKITGYFSVTPKQE
jgi:A/G-specific adenine glycosylase